MASTAPLRPLLGQTPAGAIAFYNVENLFDTEDDPANEGDDPYLPGGENAWTAERYTTKIGHIARVISEMPGPPDIVGLAEVENRKVLEDLVSHPMLARRGYQIVHFDSPDHRGIDVALVYRASKFTPFQVVNIPYTLPNNPDFSTRDILWAKGLYLGDTLHVAVNHWPSRRGSETLRVKAAELLRHCVDSVQNTNAQAKIVLMGDFNDDPSNKSIRKVLMADGKAGKLAENGFFNASTATFKQGYGTIYYKGLWSLFDQIMVSQPLLKGQHAKYYYSPGSFQVFAPPYMRNAKGENPTAPLRTFSRGKYIAGYSDHYPTFIMIAR